MSNKETPAKLVVVINSQKMLEYFRDRPLSPTQQKDLEAMDLKMNTGIQVGNQHIARPSLQDKATYMANILVTALGDNDEPKTAAACAYLATRFEELKQLRATTHSDRISIQLIFDEEYSEQIPIQFVPKKTLL